MTKLELRSTDEAGTVRLAEALAKCLEPGDVVVLEGGLGAGKTALVRGVAHALGLDPDEPVTSPSFAVVAEYETTPPLVHADLFRLGHSDELHQLGLLDSLRGDSVVFVEWGLGHEDALGRVDLVVAIAGSGDEPRHLVATARTDRGKRLVEAWASLARGESLW